MLELTNLGNLLLPLLTIVLLFTLGFSTRLKGRFHQRLFIGLTFALVASGLMVLSSNDNSFQTYSLIAMAICYLNYTRAFYLDFRSAPQLDKKGARIVIMITCLACLAFYFFLRPYLGINKLPILIYTLVFALLVMMAFFRNQRVNAESFRLIVAGSLLLMLSGLLFACHHFVNPLSYPKSLIAIIYLIGHLLVTWGGISRKLLYTETEI